MPSTPPIPDLSVVIPVYNGAEFVRDRVQGLIDFLSTQGISHEIHAIDDGSRDATRSCLLSLEGPSFFVHTHERNLGKFAAIRTGMSQARGRCCLFTDADVPFDLRIIGVMARHVLDRDVHLVIGDRTLPGSVYRAELGPVRKVATWAFSWFVRVLVTGGLFDTQCGVKAFRGDIAQMLFPLLREDGFAGDVELLYVALKYNLEIKRVPARLEFQAPSTVHPVRDGMRMAPALLRIRRRHRQGVYASRGLDALSLQDYWTARSRWKRTCPDTNVAGPDQHHEVTG